MDAQSPALEARGAAGAGAGPAAFAATRTLSTFDVFETVLVRTVSPPQAVFDVLGRRAAERGWVTCSPQAFGRARMSAEQRALRRFGDSTTLERIHAELAATLLLPADLVPRLAQAEMDAEAEMLRPVPALRPVLEQERRRSGRVVFVSDMYLPGEFIEAQLRRHGMWEPGDVLYVSHAHGRTKRSGRLYDVVARAQGVPVQRLRHHGNCPVADVSGAVDAGAQAVLLAAGNPTRYEQVLGRHRQATDGLTASMAGASRLARLDMAVTDGRQAALVEVAAGVMAPVLTAYVTWLLRRAQALGLQRLYVVAEQAQVVSRVAGQLAPALGTDVELRPLHVDRLADDPVALRYLREQGLLDGSPHGFVDGGGRAAEHGSLRRLQQEQGATPAHGMFFCLAGGEATGGQEAFHLGPCGSRDGERSSLLEVFCSGDLGTLVAWEETEHGVRPVLDHGRQVAARRWGLPLLWATLDSYVGHLAADGCLTREGVDIHPALAELMRLFWQTPTQAEAEAWAGFPRQVVGGSSWQVRPLVAPVRLRDLAGQVPRLTRSVPDPDGAVGQARSSGWPAACQALSSPPARLLLWPGPAGTDLAGWAGRRARGLVRRLVRRSRPLRARRA